ncbi:MAG: hypothetical protein ABIB47_05640 [Candidatus Woesearchaeota archaeon]
MDKRGQVFILAALLLSFIIFSLVIRLNVVKREIIEGDFSGLSKNYEVESSKFINLLAEEQFRRGELGLEDVGVLFLNFTQDFTKYSKTQNPEFGVIYFFDFSSNNEAKMFVGNYLDQDIAVWVEDAGFDGGTAVEVVEGCSEKVFAGASFGDFNFGTGVTTFDFDCGVGLERPTDENYEFTFIIGDIEYTADISVGETKIGVVANEFHDNDRRVYINEFREGSVMNFDARCDVGNSDAEGSFVCKCGKRTRENCEGLLGRCVYNEDNEEGERCEDAA